MAFGEPANSQAAQRRAKTNAQFRCSSCGRLTYRLPVHHGSIVPACPDHPDAPAMEWSADDQGAAIWIEQMLMMRTWDVVRAEVEAIATTDSSHRAKALLPVLALMERWGGALPERALPAAPAAAGNALFGVRP